MNNATKEILCDGIIHIDIGIRRFNGNEDLYESYLRQFPKDTSCETIAAALKAGDVRGAESASQALKVKSYNLGMVRLAKSCDALCLAIKQGKGLPDFADVMNEVSVVFNVMKRCIIKAFPETQEP